MMRYSLETKREWETEAEYAARIHKFLKKGDLYDKTDPATGNLVAGKHLASKPETKARRRDAQDKAKKTLKEILEDCRGCAEDAAEEDNKGEARAWRALAVRINAVIRQL